jgi:hypothetical protein
MHQNDKRAKTGDLEKKSLEALDTKSSIIQIVCSNKFSLG